MFAGFLKDANSLIPSLPFRFHERVVASVDVTGLIAFFPRRIVSHPPRTESGVALSFVTLAKNCHKVEDTVRLVHKIVGGVSCLELEVFPLMLNHDAS
jgi:hypothetical protein